MGKNPQIKKLEGIIKGLVRELEQLAPSPDRPLPESNVIYLNAKPCLRRTFNAMSVANQPRRESVGRRIDMFRRRLACLQNDPHFADNLALAA